MLGQQILLILKVQKDLVTRQNFATRDDLYTALVNCNKLYQANWLVKLLDLVQCCRELKLNDHLVYQSLFFPSNLYCFEMM